MKATERNPLVEVLRKHEAVILAEWLKEQARTVTRGDLAQDTELRNVSRDFLAAVNEGLAEGDVEGSGPGWTRAREILSALSASRATSPPCTSDPDGRPPPGSPRSWGSTPSR